MKDEEYIGQYVSWDGPTGACWAKIDSVSHTGNPRRKIFIVTDRISRRGTEIDRIYRKSVLDFELVKDCVVPGLERMSSDELLVYLLGLGEVSSDCSAFELAHSDEEALTKALRKKLEEE